MPVVLLKCFPFHWNVSNDFFEEAPPPPTCAPFHFRFHLRQNICSSSICPPHRIFTRGMEVAMRTCKTQLSAQSLCSLSLSSGYCQIQSALRASRRESAALCPCHSSVTKSHIKPFNICSDAEDSVSLKEKSQSGGREIKISNSFVKMPSWDSFIFGFVRSIFNSEWVSAAEWAPAIKKQKQLTK